MNSRTFPPDNIVWVDEAGANEYYAREYGLAPRGVKVYGEVSGKRYKRTNVVSAQCAGKVIAPCIYGWATKAAWFEVWFEWHLCPKLWPGKVVIMDNALFHRKPVLEKIAKFYGLRILWLPPYSPDLNRIELLWANMKKWLKHNAARFALIQDAIALYLKVG
jgi:transposase